jgi:hypothetical protein
MAPQTVPKSLELLRGGALLGTIELDAAHSDFPWYGGTFKPSSAYEAVRDLFERELEILRANKDDDNAQWDEWESIYAELSEPGLHLQSADGSYMAGELLIHVDGSNVWWRESPES